MTFEGHIVYLWPELHHLRPSGARVKMILRGTQINYMPDKSHLPIIIIINTQRKTRNKLILHFETNLQLYRTTK